MSAFEEKFWSQVTKSRGCWLWTGRVDTKGYGRIRYYGRDRLAHQVAFRLYKKRWPKARVHHYCLTRNCVRPEHLFDSMRGMTRGMLNGASKLTPTIAANVRRSKESTNVLAERYGVSTVAIRDIRYGRTWKINI